jgi:oxygen-independent coproporphyrinogen III oxidase
VAGIYLHIPFCRQACHYCDFHFSTSRAGQRTLTEAIAAELAIQKNYLEGEIINTIYFGGGTPSLLSGIELATLMESIHKNFQVSETAEITLEANPDDMSASILGEFSGEGINRLSIGIQSFDDAILQYMNRAHSAESALRAVHLARKSGFNNISIDLIYAVPGLSEEGWYRTIREAIALSPEHLSAYSLTIEPKTVFGHRAARKTLEPVDDDVAARHFEMLMDELEAAGFDHYEISNFSKPGYHSKHNSNYWSGEKYLGVGPSAHSYNVISRQFNISNNAAYLGAIHQGKVPYELEMLSRKDKTNDYLLTTLRTGQGSDLEWLRQQLGYDLLIQHGIYLNDLQKNDLAFIDGTRLKLTRKGKMVADKIASDLFLTT